MKTLLLFMIAYLCIACGKQNSSSNSPSDQGRRSAEGWVETSSAGETELLNITINETVILTDATIVFQKAILSEQRGEKISCNFSVNPGATWKIKKIPIGLQLEFPNGQKQTLRPATDTIDNTSWIWSGKENGIKMIRRYTFLPNRLILNQDCEG